MEHFGRAVDKPRDLQTFKIAFVLALPGDPPIAMTTGLAEAGAGGVDPWAGKRALVDYRTKSTMCTAHVAHRCEAHRQHFLRKGRRTCADLLPCRVLKARDRAILVHIHMHMAVDQSRHQGASAAVDHIDLDLFGLDTAFGLDGERIAVDTANRIGQALASARSNFDFPRAGFGNVLCNLVNLVLDDEHVDIFQAVIHPVEDHHVLEQRDLRGNVGDILRNGRRRERNCH